MDLADFVAGCTGGMAGVVVGHPMDTVKVRMQDPGKGRDYKNLRDVLVSTARNEGVHGFFKGMLSPLASVAAMNALLFGAYGTAQRALLGEDQNSKHDLTLGQIFVCGSFSGLACSVVSCPSELVKIRLQLEKHGTARTYRGFWHCLSTIYRTEGMSGLYRGMNMTMIRETPGYGIYFVSYELFRRGLTPEGQSVEELSTGRLLLAGGLAGMVGWLDYPTDVIKTRLQADMTGKYSGIVDCTRKLWQEGGGRIFWRGFLPTMLRAAPLNAATFFVYEWTLSAFGEGQ